MNKDCKQRVRETRIVVSPREFVRIWQTSDSVEEVSLKMNNNKNAVRVRAYRYRQMGVPLKEFPTLEIELINWEELANYADSIEHGQTATLDESSFPTTSHG